MFQILYAKDASEPEAAKASLRSLPHAPYIQRVEAFLQSEHELLLYRTGVVTSRQNANNYAEASVSILKDEIFSHTKAYNAVVLIEFVVDNWGKYFETRLLCYANHSENSHKTGFQYLLQKMPEIPPDSIVKVAENVFKLSSSLGNRMYGVRADVELCRRFVRDQGAFCKHQAVV